MMKTFYINASVTCLRTKTYAQKVYDYLILNGLTFNEDFRKSDLIIIDTCAYCQAKQDASIEVIKFLLKHRKNEARIIIIGCLPKIDAASVANLGNFYLISSNELEKFDNLINAKVKFNSMHAPMKVGGRLLTTYSDSFLIKTDSFLINRLMMILRLVKTLPAKEFFKKCLMFIAKNISRKNSEKYKGTDSTLIEYHVNIGKGCFGNCSYCAIKFVWGKLQSRPIDDVLKDFKDCVKINDKAKVISLETQDLGGYGLDINSTVVQLLNALFGVEGNYKIALHDLNMNWFIKYYSDLQCIFVKNADKIHYLNVPIQSGSNRILELMNRPYRIEDARIAVINLKNKVPNISMLIDIMVGFPGETSEDFEKTKQFVKEIVSCGVDIWLTPYSDRPNTEASKMKNKISQSTIDARCNDLTLLIKTKNL